MSETQYAGEYDIKTCKILSTSGTPHDISAVVEDIVLFESIFSESISGFITIQDTTDVLNNAPIIGEEKLDVFIDNTKKESSALCINDIFKLDLGNDLLITFPNVICNWYFNNTSI